MERKKLKQTNASARLVQYRFKIRGGCLYLKIFLPIIYTEIDYSDKDVLK